MDEKRRELLRGIPGVDRVLELAGTDEELERIPLAVLKRSVRSVSEGIRTDILKGGQGVSEKDLAPGAVLERAKVHALEKLKPNLVSLVNATGVVVHTNLGRSVLAREALENLLKISSGYSNLEFDLKRGKRGSRYSAVEEAICEISGAEAALVVNNNAAAVLICLETMAKDREVVVSRGELVEIGGSFRIPDVMAKSGALLREVGTTNRTHPADYENAVNENTGLFLKVHTSNYSIVGFTAEVVLSELVKIGAERGIPVMEDLGSGVFVDFSEYGLAREPTVQESVGAGADLVTFSGDKLLGGPQAGVIAGKKAVVDRIKKNPLNRALRIDKMTLAALESTLNLYRRPECVAEAIPTLEMILGPVSEIERRAAKLCGALKDLDPERMSVRVVDVVSKAGGGSLPGLDIPGKGVAVKFESMTVNAAERFLRGHEPPVIGRIEDDLFVMDMRTVRLEQLEIIETAFERMLGKG